MSLSLAWKQSGFWLAVVAVMLALHWMFFVGYLVSDDSLYLSQAMRYLSGDFTPPESHWGFRYTIVLPLTLIGLVMDYNERLLALMPLIYWIGVAWLTGWFVRRTIGREQAIYAVLLVVTLPLFVVQSTILGVDITEAFFLFASFVAFYLAETAAHPRFRGYLVAGLMLGLALVTRETAYGFLLVLGAFFLLGGYRRWPYYLVGLVGVLGVLSLEWAYYLAFDQGPLYRLQTISESHGSIGIRSGDFKSGTGNISDNRLLGPLLAVLLNQEFAAVFWVAIVATLYLYRHGDPGHRRLLRYTAIAFFVYFLWIGYSGAIRPLPRYFAFPALLAIVPIALMIGQLSRAWLRYLVLLVLIGSNLLALSVENIHPRFAARVIADFARQAGTVVTDEHSAWLARGFLRLADEDPTLVSEKIGGSTIYARVEGVPVPAAVQPQWAAVSEIQVRLPPKLLIGHLLDFSGVGTLLPAGMYRYLAIRNPGVVFYRLPPRDGA